VKCKEKRTRTNPHLCGPVAYASFRAAAGGKGAGEAGAAAGGGGGAGAGVPAGVGGGADGKLAGTDDLFTLRAPAGEKLAGTDDLFILRETATFRNRDVQVKAYYIKYKFP